MIKVHLGQASHYPIDNAHRAIDRGIAEKERDIISLNISLLWSSED
jgi:hypothetical protein